MNSEEFTYWLQGALEMNPEMLEKGMSPEQVKTIQDHLNLVFTKVTPNRFEEINISDPNSSGNPSPQHPDSICVVNNPGLDLLCAPSNLTEKLMTTTEFRKMKNSPSTGGKVYC